MGKFVRFVCHYCQYVKDIELLAEDKQSVSCPKCAETGLRARVNKIRD